MDRANVTTGRQGVGGVRAALPLLLLASLLVAVLPSSGAVAQSTGFPDVPPDGTHAQAIAALAEDGILLGFEDGTFRPLASITRAQMASVLFRAEGLDPVTPDFSDVPTEGPHTGAIGALAAAGVIEGYEDGTFRPGELIRRDHIALMVARWLGTTSSSSRYFDDVTRYGSQIAALFELGVINGTTGETYHPGRDLSREQAASLVYRALEVLRGGAELKLLATNDFHGRLEPPSGDLGGAAYLMTHLETIREQHRATLYVDGGDMVGATPVLSNLFLDEPSVRAANLMGMDVQTVGNHEFDRGRDEAERRLHGGCAPEIGCFDDERPFEGQDFPSLTTNVIDTTTGEPFLAPYELIDVAGLRVGFLGVVTVNTPEVVNPAGIPNLEFLPESEAVNDWVPVLEDEGADVIVVLMHEGGRQEVSADDHDPNACENFAGRAATVVPEFDDAVDLVVTGHTHQSYVCDLDGWPLTTQAFEYGKMFTEIDLTVDVRSRAVVDRGAQNHPVTRDVEPHPAMSALIDYYDVLAGPALEEIVGTSTVPIPRTGRSAESAQGNLAADALLDQFDVDFAFQNSGGLRADLTEAGDTDEDGNYNIRRRHVLGVWPFGNIVALAEVDGPTLGAILANGVAEVGGGRFIQVGGLRIEYVVVDTDGEFPRGEVVTVEYFGHHTEPDGTPVDLSADASYTVAMNDFMTVGGDGYPDIEDEVYSLQDPLEVAVERYLLANSPVSPAIEGRIVDVTD